MAQIRHEVRAHRIDSGLLGDVFYGADEFAVGQSLRA